MILAPAFTVAAIRRGGTNIISCTGELDVAAERDLRAALRAALEGEPETLCLDLVDVTFIDSTGLHFLLSAIREVEGRRTDLEIRASRAVERACALVGVQLPTTDGVTTDLRPA